MLPEGTLAELVDHVIYMSPAPVPGHQILLNEINFQLLLYFREQKNGMVYISPFDVYLDDEANAVQPDLCIILKENPSTVDLKSPFRGIPDLIVEILSPGNKDFDLLKKKDLYEKFGVREYWILDPETRLGLVYSLKDNHLVKISEAIGKVQSSLLDAYFQF